MRAIGRPRRICERVQRDALRLGAVQVGADDGFRARLGKAFGFVVYAARANLNPLLITGNDYGGQVSITYEIENYPGFPEGVTGQKMMMDFKAQAERFETRVAVSNGSRRGRIVIEFADVEDLARIVAAIEQHGGAAPPSS